MGDHDDKSSDCSTLDWLGDHEGNDFDQFDKHADLNIIIDSMNIVFPESKCSSKLESAKHFAVYIPTCAQTLQRSIHRSKKFLNWLTKRSGGEVVGLTK